MPEPFGLLGDCLSHEVRHRHVADRARGLGQRRDRPTVGDDHLSVRGEHTVACAHPVEGEAECLGLTQPGSDPQQDEQGYRSGIASASARTSVGASRTPG